MRFLSIVGTQVMAVLNPLLALKNAGYDVNEIDLLVTNNKKSRAHADSIKDFLKERSIFEAHQIKVYEISDSLETDENNHLPAPKVVAELSNGCEVAFNLAGGLNFQIAACVHEIPEGKCLYLYPEEHSVRAIKLDNGKIILDDYFPLPDPVDVFRLQGLESSSERQDNQNVNFLVYALKKTGVELPVIPIRPVCINSSVIFDYFWNDGNQLKFLKVIHVAKSDQKKAAFYLQEARNVIDCATKRDAFGELHHRRIAVLTNSPTVADRLREEGGGKLRVIEEVHNGKDELFREMMRSFFISTPMTAIEEEETSFENKFSQKIGRAATLYLSLGRNLMPTLISIWSHKPSKVHFLFTPNDPEIQKIKAAIIEHIQLIPVNELRFIPVSIEGSEILALQCDASEKIEVNISPGTKGHTAFLSLWAKLNNIAVFSLETKDQTLQGITHDETKPLQGPSPLDFLRFSGKSIKATGTGSKILRDKSRIYHGIGSFIRKMDAEKHNILDFPEKNIDLKESRYILLEHHRGKITMNHGKGETIEWSLVKNKWFEDLIGYAILRCGADEVDVRIRTAREPEMEKYLKQKHRADIFLSDVDVVARFNANYYVISCKTTKKEKTEKIADEVSAMANLWGRFAIPMVAFLKYPGKPRQSENKTWVFGYRTFTEPAALKELLQNAVMSLQKTGKTI